MCLEDFDAFFLIWNQINLYAFNEMCLKHNQSIFFILKNKYVSIYQPNLELS